PFGFFSCSQIDRQAARGDGWWDVENNVANPVNKFTTWQAINTTTWQANDSLTVKNIISYGEFKEYARQTLGGETWLAPGSNAQFLRLIELGYLPGSQN